MCHISNALVLLPLLCPPAPPPGATAPAAAGGTPAHPLPCPGRALRARAARGEDAVHNAQEGKEEGTEQGGGGEGRGEGIW